MKLLLDTCTFLWFQGATGDLSKNARKAILDRDNEVWLSSVSAWEIARKFANGTLHLDTSPEILIPRVREESGIEPLPLREADALMAEKLPRFHKDPFDRMLIAQALVNGMTIVTSDAVFGAYPVHVLW